MKILRRMRGVPPAEHEDIAQEAAIRAIRSFSSFDPGRGSLLGWLRAIVKHVVFEVSARKQRKREVPIEDFKNLEETIAGTDPDPEAQLGRAQLTLLARAIAEEIPVRERQVMLLKVDGMTVAQMAALLGLPDTTVKGRLLRAHSLATKVVRRWQAARRFNASDLAALALLLGSLADEPSAAASPSESPPAPLRAPPRATIRSPRPFFARPGPALLFIAVLVAIPLGLWDPSAPSLHAEGSVAMSSPPGLPAQSQALPSQSQAQAQAQAQAQSAVSALSEQASPPQSPPPSQSSLAEPPPPSAQAIPTVATGRLLSGGPPSTVAVVSRQGRDSDEWRAASRVLASLAGGRLEEARQRFAAFEGAFPGSAHAPRVRLALRAAQSSAGPASLGKPALFE